MNFEPRRILGKVLITISVVFIIAALYTLFFIQYRIYYVEPSEETERTLNMYIQEYERSMQYATISGPATPSPLMYTWPYRWLSRPLAIVGISLFLMGLLLGYHDNISQLF